MFQSAAYLRRTWWPPPVWHIPSRRRASDQDRDAAIASHASSWLYRGPLDTNICSHEKQTERLGSEDSNPPPGHPKCPVLASYTTPQWRLQDRSCAFCRYPRHPMTEPFTVLIMAAGQGTRMRSERPQGSPPDLRQADGRVGHRCRARGGRAAAWSASCGPATGWPRACRRGSRSPSSTRARAPAPRCSPRATLVEPGPFVVLSGDHPLVTPEQIATCCSHHREAGAAATLLTTELQDPAGYGRIVRDGERRRRADRRDQGQGRGLARGARHPRDQPRHLRLRGTRAVRRPRPGRRTRTASASSRAPSRCSRPRAPRSSPARPTDLDIAHGVNDRAGLMEAEELAQRRILEEHARAGVTFLHPGTTRVEAGVQIGVDTVIGPGRQPARRHDRRQRLRRSARTRPRATRASATAPAWCTPSSSRPRSTTSATIGPFAYLRPGHRGARRRPRSAPSSRSRTPTSARARRCPTCPTSAMPTSARAATSAPARSPPTTTAGASTAPRSERA